MDITVILCTYNRCQSLAKTLDSLAALKLPPPVQWEVLVVDNNSTDLTAQVVKEFSDRYPGRFRYRSEPRQGKSHALNTGIRESQSDLLAFTDDDVVVEPEWLQNLTAPLRTTLSVGVGGKTLPETGFSPPHWLALQRPCVYGPLGIFDLGDSTCQMNQPPFGNNMAFRRDVFARHGDFRTDLGPRPGSEIRSEDTELGQRILSAGEHLRYEPTAILYHAIPSNRLQKKYLLQWWSAKARANVKEFGAPEGTRFFVSGIPLYLFRRIGVWTVKWIFSVSAPKRFHAQLQVWGLASEIKEWFAQSRLQK